MEDFPHLLTFGILLILDRNWPGARRVARLGRLTHFLIRVKSSVQLTRTSEILPDGSYLATVAGDGAAVTVRVIEYFADVEGKDTPEMFCLVTDLLDAGEYPAARPRGPLQVALGRVRDRAPGSEGVPGRRRPGTGPMLRSGSPDLVAGNRGPDAGPPR